MIFIDAREGISGDMLLAALVGLVEPQVRNAVIDELVASARSMNLELRMVDVADGGDSGLRAHCSGGIEDRPNASREECYTSLDRATAGLAARDFARHVLDLIFEAEAKAHSIPVEVVHLHEIGRPQALFNIAAIAHVASRLVREIPEDFVASTITTGRGTVVVSHGAIRIPAPASAILLSSLRHEKGDSPGERATPTGIAALRALISRQSDSVPTEYSVRSVGFGSKIFEGRLGRVVAYRT